MNGTCRCSVCRAASGAWWCMEGPAHYVPTGHLVYMQLATGTLVAVPFDLARLQVGATPPVAVAEGILTREGAHYTVSANGLLAYVPGGSPVEDRTLVWVDRQGKADPLNAPGRPYETPRVSPDGEQVAFMTAGATYDVWVYNLARGNATRLVSEGSNQFPIWTPDGKRLTYRGTRAGTRNVFWRMADGSGAEERLTTGEGNHAPGSWSPNGEVLLFLLAGVGLDIMALKLPEQRDATISSNAVPRNSPTVLPGRPVGGVSVRRVGPAGGLCSALPGAGSEMADFHRRGDGASVESERSRAVLPKWEHDDGRGHGHRAGLPGGQTQTALYRRLRGARLDLSQL